MTRHLAIVGPTASGKSALALALATEVGDVELVSLDSMQVYCEMDIGTAKPTAAERAAVPHHLIDIADPSEEWSVQQTQAAARDAIAGIEARGNRAVLVGGTGLYVRAVVDELAVPGTDPKLRAEFERQTETIEQLAEAYARLEEFDGEAAARIDPMNRRRIVRALEVIELTGRPFSSFGPGLGQYGRPALDVTQIGIVHTGHVLAERSEQRLAAMREAGFLAEVEALAARPAGFARTARQAIGYRELLGYLAGEMPSLDAAFEQAALRTRQFARRQRVWFQRDPRIVWIDPMANIDEQQALVLARWSLTDSDPTLASS